MQGLLVKIMSQKKKTGCLSPMPFLQKLKQENELFNTTMHQDAHEFLNYLLNAVAENLTKHQKELDNKMAAFVPPPIPVPPATDSQKSGPETPAAKPSTWVGVRRLANTAASFS